MKINFSFFSQRVIAVLSFFGIVTMSYLLWLHFAPADSVINVLCTVGDKVSCAEVNKSAYSTILGIPMSLLGLMFFLVMFGLSFARVPDRTAGKLSLLTTAFLGPSLYLTYVEIFILQKICLYCELSKVLMILLAYIWWRKSADERPVGSEIFLTIALALLLAVGTFYIQQF